MLYEEERKQKIADYVQMNGRASVQQLAQHFQVSESTVRRDLRDLEEEQFLRRTHGGAVALQNDNIEPPFVEKEDRFQQQKLAIARAAAKLIQEGDTILLDSGTTTYHLAKLLKGFQQLTVVTNSVMVAQELASQKNIELMLTGGTLRPETLAMVGPLAERAIESLHVDKAFIATNGIDPGIGLSTPNMIEAAVKNRMVHSAKQVILLADHSKYGRVSFARVAPLSDIDHCIIDDGISVEAVNTIEATGVNVILAPNGGDSL
ncbi:DeoR/GlpR family DNA-binding transcription regulator [Paenibacillus abyssi]|uniref:DeoR family transcriptional regulator n=1 Tax=Paenibacillus abyssi TaxID=1340531 RepID=A0A917CXP9_9BACL|nr:DeoR/GlpR family DNA-binding transcription regulator [Paenibacillus abyssi]GGG02647.1 DeoR family transcriptional regulator [Paenibacillus abyssi]